MRSYWDNDIIHKLAVCDLTAQTLTALQLNTSELLVLGSARFKLLSPKMVKRLEQESPDKKAAGRVEAFLKTTRNVSADAHADDLPLLQGVDGIDAGEMVLLSVASRDPDSVLLTGDKRCIQALLSAPACRPIVDRLRGRVICLEQIVRILIVTDGFTAVLPHVATVSCDKALGAIFGSGVKSKEASVRDGLDSYIDSIDPGPRLLAGDSGVLEVRTTGGRLSCRSLIRLTALTHAVLHHGRVIDGLGVRFAGYISRRRPDGKLPLARIVVRGESFKPAAFSQVELDNFVTKARADGRTIWFNHEPVATKNGADIEITMLPSKEQLERALRELEALGLPADLLFSRAPQAQAEPRMRMRWSAASAPLDVDGLDQLLL